MKVITACIVLYENNVEVLNKAISSVLKTKSDLKLFIVDNSKTDDLRYAMPVGNIEYIHNPSNPGFGASHNIAINKAIELGSNCHFVVNPDIYFDHDVITPMVNYMQSHDDIGMIMPQILYPDNSLQNLPKLLPNPLWLLRRKIKFPYNCYKKFVSKYELHEVPPGLIYNSPLISGCFSLLNLKVIKEVGGYDDRYFMYFEDFDLSRRIHEKYRTIYYPLVSVYHGYEGGANKNFKLFKIFVQSAISYFSKWGWLDRERIKINNRALSQFQ
ncbi:glycosyltransferase [Mucilaginibacter antarcticus]|uniref:Glycosyltransferase n=1 Tax=Mucilaginibacter antarcticus TaxID=1855725 RepID=A0ABW5XNY2_9SPHI